MRADLTAALAMAAAEKGYAGVTIADIVAHARVSRRTFYEHFTDKEDCLIALYELASEHLIEVIRSASSPGRPWRERVREMVTAYLTVLEATPAARVLIVEMQAAGARAYLLRQQVQRRFAEALVELVAEGLPANPEVMPLTPALAMALVGGINELLLQAIDPYAVFDPAPAFTPLTEVVIDLVSAVLVYRR